MKKITALFLAVVMMCSIFVPVSAEGTRDEFLNTPSMEYVELYLFQDVFATYKERASADWYEWTTGEGEITAIWPFKGIGNGIEPKYPFSRTAATNEYAMMITLEGKSASAYKTAVALDSNPLVSYDGNLERYMVTAGNVKYKLGEIAEGKKGTNFATFGVTYNLTSNAIADSLGIKEQELNSSVYPNIGTSAQVQKAIYPINKSGVKEINFLLATMQVSSSGKDRATRVPVTIEYEGGEKVNLAVLVGTIGVNFQETVFAAPKSSSTYAEINTNKVVANTVLGKNVTNENITIPATSGKIYLPEESFVLATQMRSWDGGQFDGYVNSFSIPVDSEKTIKSVTFEKTSDAIVNYFTESYADKTSGTDRMAFVPVTIEGASGDYNYYLHVTRSCGSTGIFAMTLTGSTLKEEIADVEAKIRALSGTYSEEMDEVIAEIEEKINSLKENGVLESDFNSAVIGKFNTLLNAKKQEAIRAEKVKALEDKIEALASKYSASLKAEFEAVKTEYDALIAEGIKDSDLDAELLAKYKTLYSVYVVATELEAKAGVWGAEYSYTMYDGVLAAKELSDSVVNNDAAAQDAVLPAILEKVDAFYEIAVEAKVIEEKIDELANEYVSSMTDALIFIKNSIEALKTKGGTDNAINGDKLAKFNRLYTDAENDKKAQLQTKWAEVERLMDEIGESYEASEREKMELTKEKYEAFVKLEGANELIVTSKVEIFDNLYTNVYKRAIALEETVNSWTEYTYSMYDAVANASSELLELSALGSDEAVGNAVVLKINSYCEIAVKGKELDSKIEGLKNAFEPSMTQTVKEMKKEVDDFIKIGATEKALVYADKFNALYKEYEAQRGFITAPASDYVELHLFQDVFATYAEKTGKLWGQWNGTSSISDIYAFKGFGTAQEMKYPSSEVASSSITSKRNQYAYLIDHTDSGKTTLENNEKVTYDETLKRYIVTAKNGKYKLGEIAEGKKGGNFITFGMTYDTTTYAIADGLGIKEEVLDTTMYPNVGTASQITKAVIPVGKSATSINLLMTANNASEAAFMPVTIKYKDGETENIWIYVGTTNKDFQDYIIAADPSYETFADISTNGKKASTVLGKNVENSEITFPASTGSMYSNSKGCDTFYIPEESFKLATFFRNASTYYDGYVHSFSIPVKEDKIIDTVTFEKMGGNLTTGYYSQVGAYCNGTNSDAAAFIPITVANADNNYKYYIRTLRACGRAGMFAMTLSSPAIQEDIDALEEKIAELPENYNLSQQSKIIAIYEDVQKLKTNKGVLDTDFNTSVIEKLNRLYNIAINDTTKNEKMEELAELFARVPESFSLENGKQLVETEELINEIIEELNLVEADVIAAAGSQEVYDRYVNYLALYREKMDTINTDDNIRIDFSLFNSQAVADIFEYSTVNNASQIPDKKGITMYEKNTDYLPAEVKKGNQIGFYTTDKVQEKYGTFPNAYGEYKITNDGISYIYAGVSNEIGKNTFNATRVSSSYSFETTFDGATPYKQISILANGVIYLTGAHSRQAQAVKTTVFFADGTTKSEISVVGPFAYGYKTTIYSIGAGETYPRSEYLNSNVASKLDAITFIPKEANADGYFNMSVGLANRNTTDTYNEFYTSNEFGNATVINIDTDNKAITRVKIEAPTANDLLALGAVPYDKFTYTNGGNPVTTESTSTYYLPLDKTQFASQAAYDASREYSISVMLNKSRPVYVHAITGVKTTATSYNQDIAQIEADIRALKGTFENAEVAKMHAIKGKIDALVSHGIPKDFIDSDSIEKLETLLDYNVSEEGYYEIYVSPDGDDEAFGYKEMPVRTLDRAFSLALASGNTSPINIVMLEGEYKLDKTVTVPVKLSGTPKAPVTLKGENAVITTADTISSSAFTKLSASEREKVQAEVADKIVKVDLSQFGINVGPMPAYSSISILDGGAEDVSIIVNGKEQLIAQYPNGESNYDTWERIVDDDINAVVMRVNARHAENWQGEKFGYFEGYPAPDYSNERNNVVFDGDLIKFQNKARFDALESCSRRYKVKHVLYELDVPGEWYIDRDTEVLYYYPTEDFDGAEIKILSEDFDAIKTENGLENFTFNGITVSGVRGNALVAGKGHKNVNIYNCKFTDVNGVAVNYTATQNYTSSATLSGTSNYTDAAKECEIRNNKFENIGRNAIVFCGGNRQTLADGNNVIANNYIYNASNKARCNPVISVNGAKNYVLNNEIHMGTFHAINHSGNENVIAYNELYNMLRDTGDCGVIYAGRQLATRGTEIAYNYIHDYKHLDSRTHDNGVGIYLDDRLSGINVHHNILFGNGTTASANGIQNGGGQHNTINYNIIVDTEESITRTNRFTEGYTSDSSSTAFDEIIRISGMDDTNIINLDDGKTKTYKMLGRNEFYFERYPEMNESIETLLNPNQTVKEFVNKYSYILDNLPYGTSKPTLYNLKNDISAGNDLTKYRLISLKAPLKNTYIGNSTNTPWRDLGEDDIYVAFGGTFSNNTTATTSDYVNYAGKDFRIKSSSSSYVKGMLNEDFDMSLIGIQEDGSISYDLDFDIKFTPVTSPRVVDAEEKQFNLTYPANNSQVADKSKITLMWERPVSSDYFTVEIATDPQMSNIVYRNENVYYDFHVVEGLENVDSDKFYWRVRARNISKDDSSEWYNSDGVNSFNTDYVLAVDVYSDPCTTFDISGSFNADLFNNEGETVSSFLGMGGMTIGGDGNLGMYNLTNLKRKVPESGYYKFKDTTYHFPQVGYTSGGSWLSKDKNAVKTTKGKSTTITLKTAETGYYDEVKVVMSAAYAAKDYSIKAHYSDGTYDESKVAIHQYYTTYHSYEAADTIMVVDGVNSKGQVISELAVNNANKLYVATVETDVNKVLTKLEFVGGSGTVYDGKSNEEYIFAITGVHGTRTLDNGNKEQTVVVKNYTGAEKEANLIVSGYEDGQYKTVIIPVTVKNNKENGIMSYEIPAKVNNMTEKTMFMWDADPKVMKAYTPKLNIR